MLYDLIPLFFPFLYHVTGSRGDLDLLGTATRICVSARTTTAVGYFLPKLSLRNPDETGRKTISSLEGKEISINSAVECHDCLSHCMCEIRHPGAAAHFVSTLTHCTLYSIYLSLTQFTVHTSSQDNSSTASKSSCLVVIGFDLNRPRSMYMPIPGIAARWQTRQLPRQNLNSSGYVASYHRFKII